mmetsp:Transcript_12053/g.29109  ORF Transcript_12053/g.29109 Transcript_12053/m.29109 type:complete len:122 (-) Transcript_12053:2636-3001(-)
MGGFNIRDPEDKGRSEATGVPTALTLCMGDCGLLAVATRVASASTFGATGSSADESDRIVSTLSGDVVVCTLSVKLPTVLTSCPFAPVEAAGFCCGCSVAAADVDGREPSDPSFGVRLRST